ncbi:MAG: GGDEF domain-containing protein [Clostridiaceae bacterium]|nr:GGDEF domain-containing protein [Clostridiaceae bacterium]
MKYGEALLWIVIIFLLYMNELRIDQLPGIGEGETGTKVEYMIRSFVKAGILFSGWYIHLPLFIVYLLIFCGYGMTFWSIGKRSRLNLFFWMNFFSVCFIAVNLISMAAVSLVTGSMLRDVYLSNTYCVITLCITLIMIHLMNKLWKKKIFADWITLLTSDEKRFNQLIFFEWYALGYLIFDSTSCVFVLPYSLLSVFLIGSCILLMIQFILFLAHTHRIIEKAHYEAEYYRLEEERAEHVKRQMILQKLAYIDGLTGAFTRRYAMEMLESMQKDGLEVTVAYIDVNGLKKVNDTLGHQEGDRYLKLIADSLNESLNKSDILSRIGGDEFMIVSNSAEKEGLESMLKKVNELLGTAGREGYRPSFSYGVVSAPHKEPFDLEELLRESDRRMYVNKMQFKRGNV